MEILSPVASTTPFNFIEAKVKSESLSESKLHVQPDQNEKLKVNLTMAKKKSESRTVFIEGSLSNAPRPSLYCPEYLKNIQLP